MRKPMLNGPIELNDLSRDVGGKYNVDRTYPGVVREIESVMAREHEKPPNWQVPYPR